MATEFVGRKEFVGDYAYWVTRDGEGETQGWRQLLRGEKVDPAYSTQGVPGDQLPIARLRDQYQVLAAGGMPSIT